MKVVGEVKEAAVEELGKRTKRAEGSYSEKEYHKKIEAALSYPGKGHVDDVDDASLSSAYSTDSDEDSVDEKLLMDNAALARLTKATKSKKKEERCQWNGNGPTEWRQADAEVVMKSLMSYGYGNLPWPRLKSTLLLKKTMSIDEIKRMSWALALLCLYEIAEDNAMEATRKAEAASKEKQTEGGVLGRAGNDDGDESTTRAESDNGAAADGSDNVKTPAVKKPEDQLEESFELLLKDNRSWVDKALADALAFSRTLESPRDKQHVQSIMDGNHNSTSSNNEVNEVQVKLTADFDANVWPALRSRGWKNDEKKKGYTYKAKTYKSITTVLGVIPKFHPELMDMANSLISSLEQSHCEPSAVSNSIATIDTENISARSLKLFLMDCAPMQLLADRKRGHRVNLTRRLLTHIVLLDGIHKAVATSDSALSPDASMDERHAQLSKLMNIDSRTSLPHPEWTVLHDAILIRGVAKHGWLNRDGAETALAQDSTIKWGAPFEIETNKEPEAKEQDPDAEAKFQVAYTELLSTASRAIAFLNELVDEKFVEAIPAMIRNEMRERLITSFGLNRNESDETWTVDETELEEILRPSKGKGADKQDLPSRKKLVKRCRRIANMLIGKVSSHDEEKDDAPEANAVDDVRKSTSHGFHVIDVSDRHNILICEMIRGLLMLKSNTKADILKQSMSLVLDEISARVENLSDRDGNDDAVAVLKKMKKDIKLYSKTQAKSKRGAKNILRVMVS